MADIYVVERSTKIAAAPAEVFTHVVDLHQWEHWSPWADMDPNMVKTYAGEAGTVGSEYHWTGNRKVGEGHMTVTTVEAPSRVAIALQFLKPFKSESVTEIVVSADGDGSDVVWRMAGEKTFMVKVMGLIGKNMDKMVGPDFEKGLASLKTVVER